MIDIEKFKSAKMWIEKLANGVNPLNDELVKDDDLINNVHISRCLFYDPLLSGPLALNLHYEAILLPEPLVTVSFPQEYNHLLIGQSLQYR